MLTRRNRFTRSTISLIVSDFFFRPGFFGGTDAAVLPVPATLGAGDPATDDPATLGAGNSTILGAGDPATRGTGEPSGS